MKHTRLIAVAALMAGLALPTALRAADSGHDHGHDAAPAAAAKGKKAKPYPLDYCLVSDEKFEGSDMKPHEFVHEGQTIKLCCKNCLKDFKKEPKKYLTKLDEAVKKRDAAKSAK